MITCFADESFANKGGAEEYNLSIYGGMVLKEKTFKELTDFLYKIKDNYVIPQEVEIKWRFKSYWDNLKLLGVIDKSFTQESKPEAYESFKSDHSKLKEKILDKIASTDAKIIVAIRPNKLLRASEEQIIEYSIGAVARKFEKILEKEKEFGIILADELMKKINPKAEIDHEYILNLCCRGSGAVTFNHLISIVPTINSHISPIHQLNDVLLGSIQYYILQFIRQLTEPSRNIDDAKNILGKIIGNFYKSKGGMYTINSGILMYPPKVYRKSTPAGVFLDKLEKQLEKDFNIK